MKFALISCLLLASASLGIAADLDAISPRHSTNSDIDTTTGKAPEFDRLFRGKGPWVGGDGAESLSLGHGRILWLFGDSLIGSICGRQRQINGIISNSVAIQNGSDPKTATMKFYVGASGKSPAAFIRPERGSSGWFWLSHGGVRTGNSLYLFMPKLERVEKASSAWGFRTEGMFMARISNPDAVPNRWVIRQFRLPWFHRDAAGNERYFGISPLEDVNWIYIFGFDFVKSTGNRNLLVARVKAGNLERFSSWKFYSNGRWQRDFMKSLGLCDHVGAEFSVTRLPFLGKYVLITTKNGLSDNIVMHLADSPEGPWGPQSTIYRAPEPRRAPSLMCYAAKAHPELASRGDELIVSYVCNSPDPKQLASDARLYFPEFVRVKFPDRPGRTHP